MLLSEATEKFLRHLKGIGRSKETIRGYRIVLDHFVNYFAEIFNGPVYLDDISYHDLDEFIYFMKEDKKWQPNSVKKCHYTLRSFFGYCFRKELCSKDISQHMEPVQGEMKEREHLTPGEFYQLLEQIDKPLIQLIAKTIYFSGMRTNECLSLRLNDVDLGKRVFLIRKPKGNRDRKIPIHDELIDELSGYLWERKSKVNSDYFFATEKTGKVSLQYVNSELKEAARKLGWTKNISSHILRHSFASNLIKQGVNLVHVQKLLGHADLRTTSVYTHANMEELTSSVNLLSTK